jgi:putative methionine-R-sulfoxide reductase with GAF domain
MKRRLENIAILLFVLFLICAIVGIVMVQQGMAQIIESSDYGFIRDSIQSLSWRLIFVMLFLVAISGSILYIMFLISRKNKQHFEMQRQEEQQANLEMLSQAEAQNLGNNMKQDKTKRLEQLKLQVQDLNQSQIPINEYCNKVLSLMADEFEVFQGLFYLLLKDEGIGSYLSITGTYAFNKRDDFTLNLGEGLAGQVAKAKRTVNIKQIPNGYIKAVSGLGENTPSNLIITPLLYKNETLGVLELASFKEFSKEEEQFFTQLGEIMVEKIVQSNN